MRTRLAIFAFLGVFCLPLLSHAAEPQMCYELYKPVCAAVQVECFAAPCYPVYKTFSNSCFMDQAHAKLIHEGECTASETGPIKPTATTTAQGATSSSKPHPVPPVPVATTTHATSSPATTTVSAPNYSFIQYFWILIRHLFGLK